uniref:Peptide chain release factor 1 n=1 Tax=Candidatus Aschnera chinzeii TaxID=1485666 RepID=A0AAT9G539_9ENTR|nr:MAG: peptide chain release factor 1 [Candidatus Aschnera chinzeii]
MNDLLFIKINLIEKRYQEILHHLMNPKIISNQLKFSILSKEYNELSNIMKYFQLWQKNEKEITKIKDLFNDPELCEVVKLEINNLQKENKKLKAKLQNLLFLHDPNDSKNCFLEIRAGTGGNEAALFAHDLYKMYIKYAELSQWNVDIIHLCESEYGGYKEIIIKISGHNVYGTLKFESGGHRVQRIPQTESQGRIHTSTCVVVVLVEVPEMEFSKIHSTDLKIDTFRSSGAGGQHVNTTNSAIRITHIPTGIVVECQDERSQHKNKAKAMSVLAARVHSLELQKKNETEASYRSNLLSSGTRSDRIRTYNYHQQRITDHRINLTLYNLHEILEGKLDLIINPIIDKYKIEQLSIK